MNKPATPHSLLLLVSFLGWFAVSASDAADAPRKPNAAETSPDDAGAGKAAASEKHSDIIPLSKEYDLWIDRKQKLVIVDGKVCLREGQLEMFACPQGTKEHESVVAVNCKSRYVHAALLAVGAEPGTPVRFAPSYRPATGTRVDILLLWEDKQGERHQARAQEWIKHVPTGKPMPYSWVFAGSGFSVDDTTGARYYHADGGDLICVSNFPSATLDLPVKSSQENANLLFAAFTEHIPPLGTKVRLVLIPRLEKTPEKTPASPQEETSG
jgi:hypothetical protein